MKNKKRIIVVVLMVCVAIGVSIVLGVFSHRDKKDVFHGASPQALEIEVPDGLSLTIDGKVKQTYLFDTQSFRSMARIRIRTGEITPDGEIMGAYIYTGIPVTYILEGVSAQKDKTDAFDRPLDMVVVFTSSDGHTARFSYGELTMNTDSLPITLAYNREPLKPFKNPDSYSRNKYTEDIEGLRLICPRERDTSRYLDNVTRITLTQPLAPDKLLPPMQKNKNCKAPSFELIEGGTLKVPSYEAVPIITVSNWFRIGHGMGIKGDRLYSAGGYHLPTFLKFNFPGCAPEDFFLFVGCDGYRSIFSGREIFCTDAGNSFMLIKAIDEDIEESGGFTMGAVTDFFVDRCVKKITHIVRLNR